MKTTRLVAASFFLAYVAISCTKVHYDNPLDSKGTSYIGDDGAGDSDGDGIANMYDRDLDKEPPVITILGGDTVSVPVGDPESRLAQLSVRAIDALDGDITAAVKQQSTVSIFEPGFYSITYSVSDSAGNSASALRTIRIYPVDHTDTIAPVITLRGLTVVEILSGDTYIEAGAIAFDDIDGDLSSAIKIIGSVNNSVPGTNILTYEVFDKAGNRATVVRTVNVKSSGTTDFAAPVLALKGAALIIITPGTQWIDSGCTAIDETDGDLTGSIKVTGTVNINVPGDYTITYTVSDKAGNVSNKTRIVRVSGGALNDTIAPVITLKGASEITVAQGSTYADPGVTAIDETDGDLSNSVKQSGTVSTDKAGSYLITYSVSDAAGNTATKTRTVVVKVSSTTDTTAPVIILKGLNPINLSAGAAYQEPGATAADDVDGDISQRIEITGSVDAGTAGTYTITYTVSDLAQNSTHATRTVIVGGAKDTGSGDYSVPQQEPFASIDAKYTSVKVSGTGGPDISYMTSFQINWDLANRGLYTFAFNISKPDWYVPLHGKVTHTLDKPQPALTIAGSGLEGIDGEYYITTAGTSLILASKSGTFALIFEP